MNFVNVIIMMRVFDIIIIIDFFVEDVVLNITVLIFFFRIQYVECYSIFVNTFQHFIIYKNHHIHLNFFEDLRGSLIEDVVLY